MMSRGLDKCRLCLQAGFKYNSIFDIDSNMQFAQMVMEVTKIKINRHDGLPQMICAKCILRLQQAYNFKTLSEKIDDVLHENNTQNINISITQASVSNYETEKATTSPKTIHIPKPIQSPPSDNSDKRTNQNSSRSNGNQENINKKSKITDPVKVEYSVTPKLYHCTICNSKFTLYIALKKHLNKCKKLNKPQTTIKPLTEKPLSSEMKPNIVCIICHKQFKTRINLNRHIGKVHKMIPIQNK